MRAKLVNEKIKNSKAYIFDFDDVLVKTDAKTKVYKKGKFFKFLTPEEFNFYEKLPGEELDLSDFKDPRFIINARKFKMWPALYNISAAVQQGRSQSNIFILTARSEHVKSAIHNFFIKNNVFIPIKNIITIGDDKGEIHIPTAKREILKNIKISYDEVFFFDDNPENIKIASEIGGIRTRLIDSIAV